METEETLTGWIKRIAFAALKKLREREGVEDRVTNLLVEWGDQALAIQEGGPLIREYLEAITANVAVYRANSDPDALEAIELNVERALAILPAALEPETVN